ncbi:hypothetical protein L7F22_048460 [Adiantum nelumboides]|nr:hypothetical protein [Adiantum nelumboides]
MSLSMTWEEECPWEVLQEVFMLAGSDMKQLQGFEFSTGVTEEKTEFFRDWLDNRNNKQSPKHPDLKYRITEELLLMDHRRNLSWVDDDLHITMASTADAFPPALIWECLKQKDLSRGSRLHHELLQRVLAEKDYSDALITMYARCDEPQKAQKILVIHSSRGTIPWTALIASYTKAGQGQNALDCFEQMQREGISPDAVTYACILKSCAVIGGIDMGKQIHDEITRQGLLEHDIVVGGALVNMYAKCGALLLAESVLEELPSHTVVSWNALITGYAQEGGGGFMAMQAGASSPQAAYAGVKSGTPLADMGVLVSGCQSDKTSADGKPRGRFEWLMRVRV